MQKTQSPDIQAQLNQARENLQRLGNAVSELVNFSPDVFGDEAIKARLQDFQQAYKEATQRLANPSFRIATIGTTSSGKSTIVFHHLNIPNLNLLIYLQELAVLESLCKI
ncbi:hypothetical protein [Cyanobacterium aponinum]|uniref:hypothetical protein n=1 Tax=Cyanobacterium aponinum TaxID=379064 RepID=UPI001F4D4833|nr:hypothetical protein [Cyanobacterium aponinum]